MRLRRPRSSSSPPASLGIAYVITLDAEDVAHRAAQAVALDPVAMAELLAGLDGDDGDQAAGAYALLLAGATEAHRLIVEGLTAVLEDAYATDPATAGPLNRLRAALAASAAR